MVSRALARGTTNQARKEGNTYGTTTETDTLLRVEDGTLPHEGLDTTGTTVSLVKGDLANDIVAIVPAIASATVDCYLCLEGRGNDILAELLDLLDLGGQVVGKGVLEGLSKHISNSIEASWSWNHLPWPLRRSSSARRSRRRSAQALRQRTAERKYQCGEK